MERGLRLGWRGVVFRCFRPDRAVARRKRRRREAAACPLTTALARRTATDRRRRSRAATTAASHIDRWAANGGVNNHYVFRLDAIISRQNALRSNKHFACNGGGMWRGVGAGHRASGMAAKNAAASAVAARLVAAGINVAASNVSSAYARRAWRCRRAWATGIAARRLFLASSIASVAPQNI